MTTTRSTSAETYRLIERDGLLSRMRLETYRLLYKYGPGTENEIREKSRAEIKSWELLAGINKRLPELRSLGVAKELGKRCCSISGCICIVWDVTDQLPKAPVKHAESIKHRIERLEEEKAALIVENAKLKIMLSERKDLT